MPRIFTQPPPKKKKNIIVTYSDKYHRNPVTPKDQPGFRRRAFLSRP